MTHCILQFSFIQCFIKTKNSQTAVKFMQSFNFLNDLNVIKIYLHKIFNRFNFQNLMSCEYLVNLIFKRPYCFWLTIKIFCYISSSCLHFSKCFSDQLVVFLSSFAVSSRLFWSWNSKFLIKSLWSKFDLSHKIIEVLISMSCEIIYV